MRIQRAVNWWFLPCFGQQTRKENYVRVRAYFMCSMFIKQTDANVSSLLECLWPYACFACSKSLEIKICGFSRWSPGMDSKAVTSGEGWKEDQSVGGCYNYFFLYSFFTVLGSKHRRNNSLNVSSFVPQILLSFFDRSGSPTPRAIGINSLIFLY